MVMIGGIPMEFTEHYVYTKAIVATKVYVANLAIEVMRIMHTYTYTVYIRICIYVRTLVLPHVHSSLNQLNRIKVSQIELSNIPKLHDGARPLLINACFGDGRFSRTHDGTPSCALFGLRNRQNRLHHLLKYFVHALVGLAGHLE